MRNNGKLDYVEFPARNLEETKAFFTAVFNWQFTDYGPEYTAFENQGLDGGFYQSELSGTSQNGGALLVFFSEQLEATKQKVLDAGGSISKDTFDFPGGRRFQFVEPSGNEFAVWSDQ